MFYVWKDGLQSLNSVTDTWLQQTPQMSVSHPAVDAELRELTQIEQGRKHWPPGGVLRGITYAAVSSGYFCCLQSVSQEATVSSSDQPCSLIHPGLQFCSFNLWPHFNVLHSGTSWWRRAALQCVCRVCGHTQVVVPLSHTHRPKAACKVVSMLTAFIFINKLFN